TFVTTRPPLLMSAGRRHVFTISDFRKQEYFCAGDWTGQISLKSLTNLVFWRALFCRLREGTANQVLFELRLRLRLRNPRQQPGRIAAAPGVFGNEQCEGLSHAIGGSDVLGQTMLVGREQYAFMEIRIIKPGMAREQKNEQRRSRQGKAFGNRHFVRALSLL